jgi:Flp pilus assembly protein TadG
MARSVPRWLSSCSTPSCNNEAGQVLILFVLLIPVLLGMAALAIDLGTYSAERRTLQNDADSIALAAAQDLPDESAAQATAQDWATDLGYAAADVTVVTQPASTSDPNPSVRVTIDQTHEFAFMRALGVSEAAVGATAKAVKTSPGGMGNVVPWAVLESTRDSTEPGETVVLKYDSNNVESGNFGAIRLDGNGSSVYRDSIEGGSTSTICSTATTSCTETSPVCTGAECQSETGNMVGPTRGGVDYRIENTDSYCDDFDEVFTDDGEGTYTLAAECNPWIDSSYTSLRVIVVPVISSLCNGSCAVTVTGFSLFWLDGYPNGRCTGSDCEIEGRFINADLTMGGLLGQYDPDSSVHFARLVE